MAKTVHYVSFLTHGIIPGKKSELEIKIRDPRKQAADASDGVYGFRYFDVETADVTIDGEQVPVRGHRLNTTGIYFIDAEAFDTEKTLDKSADIQAIAPKLRSQGITQAVKTRRGNIFEFSPGRDSVIVTR